jgi:hypothetical protein
VLSEEEIQGCYADGASGEELASEFEKFMLYHRENATFSADWPSTWGRWWHRWKEHRAKTAKPKAKPRIEVNSRGRETPIPPDWKPNDAHRALSLAEGHDPDEMEAGFRDGCASKGYRYIDHNAAFRNYIRNQKNFKRGNNGVRPNSSPGRGSIVNAADQALGGIAREIAEIEAFGVRDALREDDVPVLSSQRLR